VELQPYAPAFATLSPVTTAVEVVPTVDGSAHTAWMTVAGVNPTSSWTGSLTLNLAGLGLPQGTYHLVNVGTGKSIPATAGPQGVTVSLSIPPGFLQVWRLEPGAGPAAPAPSS
jgi:hypothetical protein